MSQENPLAENSPATPNPDEIVRQITKRFPRAKVRELLDIIRTEHPDLEINSEVCDCIRRYRPQVGAEHSDGTSYGMIAAILGSISLPLYAFGLPLYVDGVKDDVAKACVSIPLAAFGLIYAMVGFAKDKTGGAAFMGLVISGLVLILFAWHLIIATA